MNEYQGHKKEEKSDRKIRQKAKYQLVIDHCKDF